MGKAKRERQRAGRQARLAAAAAAQKRAARRRFAVYLGVLAVVIVGVLVLITRGGDDESDDVAAGTTTSTPTTAAARSSAAGKPCVAVSEPLPAGAPDVPVEVGPPPTQLVTRDLVTGDGPTVPQGATVTAHYVGVACTTGVIFDSSYSRGQPIPFSLSSVIPGWQQGIPGMKVGGRRLLGIPAELANGPSPASNKILPDEPLWFVVDVVGVS